MEIEVFLRVRYAETDQMGYVYYGNYAQYFEVARAEYFRKLGLSYKTLESEDGVMMPVLEMNCKYYKPAKYDDMLCIKTSIPKVPSGVRVQFDFEVFNQDNVLLTKGMTMLAFVDVESKKPVRCPKKILEIVEKQIS